MVQCSILGVWFVVRRDPPTTPTVRVGKLRGHTLPRHESTSTRPASNIGTVISTPSLGENRIYCVRPKTRKDTIVKEEYTKLR